MNTQVRDTIRLDNPLSCWGTCYTKITKNTRPILILPPSVPRRSLEDNITLTVEVLYSVKDHCCTTSKSILITPSLETIKLKPFETWQGKVKRGPVLHLLPKTKWMTGLKRSTNIDNRQMYAMVLVYSSSFP